MHALTLPRSLAAVVSTAGLAVLLAAATVAQDDSLPSPELSTEPSPAPSAAPAELRPEGTWDVIAFDAWAGGLVEPRPTTTLTASFLPEGRLEGETGCGTYFGGYLLDGESLHMQVISKGPDPCGVKRTEEAVAYSVAVEAVTRWQPTASGLELVDETGAVRVILGHASEVDLTGDWVVVRFAKPNGKLVQPLPGSPATISFVTEGGVFGSTGCRLFEGAYQSESDRVVIAPVETIGLPCEGDERRQERRLLAAIDSAVLWARDADGLVLGDGFEKPLVELRPAPPPIETPEPDASVTPTEEGV